MIRQLRKPPDEATLHDCVAHRCDAHQDIGVWSATISGPEGKEAECALCVAQECIKSMAAESIFPVALAFEKAEGQLRLLGVDRNPATAPLFFLLEALLEKTGENDFEIHAQRLLQEVPVADEPEGVQ